VSGRVADFLRFVWGLLYWNTRKSWFQLRRGRVRCPCQSPSDSGRAYETHCEACVHWDTPRRFRRVCPLLVETPDGLRCSVNTEDVRPFWGIAVRFYGGTFLGLYAAIILTIFIFLRMVGYPISIVHLAYPPQWHRVGQSRGWFFLKRAQESFAAGRTPEGLLYLTNAYEFDPTNYDLGLTLARTYQIRQPGQSDAIYHRLLETHPERRSLTAQQWVRALLARGDFDQITTLAVAELARDPARANAWMRALIFSTRHAHDNDTIHKLAETTDAALVAWRPLLETEILLRSKRNRDAAALVRRAWPANAPPYTVIYRAETLAQLGEPAAALDFLVAHRARLDDEAYWTVRFDCLAMIGAAQTLRSEFTAVLLDASVNQPRVKMMCAQLIRHPDKELFGRVMDKIERGHMPFNDDTAGGWFSLLCTAGAVGDQPQLRNLTLRLRQETKSNFNALLGVERFFDNKVPEAGAVSFLPALPVPLEVGYALIDRYPGREGKAFDFFQP
jgi:hypothetical protein